MKKVLLTLLGICLVTSISAQEPVDNPPVINLTAPELDELLGPIALYPDALISLILPASTAPMDIVLAARFVASDGNLAGVEEKPWDSSVRALTRYPDTLKWLDENLEWTSQVGNAFIAQPVEVMESIQHLRGMARALGNLVDTPQQKIVLDDTYIRIVPAQPDYIYEPRYDPEIIYYERPVAEPYLYFSVGFFVGSWLNYDCDWRRHRLYRGDWNEGWDYRRDRDSDRRGDRGDNVYINNNFTNVQEWRPDPIRNRKQSRSVAERISNDSNNLGRTQSRDQGITDGRTADRKSGIDGRVQSNDSAVNESRKRHEGINRPKPIKGSPQHPDGVKRNEQNDRVKGGAMLGRSDDETVPKALKEKTADEESKGRVSKPKSVAPGMSGDGKNKGEDRDGGGRKKPANESSAVSSRIEAPSKKEGEGKSRADMSDGKRNDAALNEELKRREESKRNDVPKREETQKKKEQEMPGRAVEARKENPPKVETPKREAPNQDVPKRAEATRQESSKKGEAPKREEPKRKEAPKQVVAPRQQDMPKRQEAPKREEPKRQEAPKREEPKREQVQKKQESPKRPESARREEPRKEQVKPSAPSEPAKAKAKADDKKKEEKEKAKKKK
ncbi:MAG: hypothetical protein RL693_1642 [Verrucomicrobiota bacterium]|jgi:hypothetical protein